MDGVRSKALRPTSSVEKSAVVEVGEGLPPTLAWPAFLKGTEQALLDHPAIAEAGVVQRPDPQKGEVCTAFVVLRPGYEPSEAVQAEIGRYLESRLGVEACPGEIRFCRALPKTRSGKILWISLLAAEVNA